MPIDDFVLACSIDDSPAYFTYDNDTNMIIIQSKDSSKNNISDFDNIEPFIDTLISHESIHLVIKKLEGAMISESLDDIEIIVERGSKKYQVTINNILFAQDGSGLVLY